MTFTYIAFKDLLCGMLVDLESDHIASKSVETLRISPTHWLFIKKLSLGHLQYTGYRFL